MRNNIISYLFDGKKCIYDLPINLTESEFMSLIYGFETSERLRPELHLQPKLLGFAGPMFNGYKVINGEKITVVRYEKVK